MSKYSDYIQQPAIFRVSGRGTFPTDMLRHDVCAPASVEDEAKMGERGQRVIVLEIKRRIHITPARWASFGWAVEYDW